MVGEDLQVYLGILGSFMAILITGITLINRMETRFAKIEARIDTLENKIEPFWECIKTYIPKLITHNPNRQLLDKLATGIITIQEAEELKKEIDSEFDHATETDKLKYLLLQMYLNHKIKNGE